MGRTIEFDVVKSVFKVSDLHHCFDVTRYKALKWNHYFKIYEDLLSDLRGKSPTVVEVGILNGGSLEMWARFLGVGSLVIGVDVRIPKIDQNEWNRTLKEQGFGAVQMVQANAESESFWRSFYVDNPNVDVFIDDGGHTNRQQITAVSAAIKGIRPGGLVICEDTQTSLDWRNGNPHKYSFQNYSFHLAGSLTRKMIAKRSLPESTICEQQVESVSFYPGLVAIRTRRQAGETFVVDENSQFEASPTGRHAPSIQSRFVSAARLAILSRGLNKSYFGKKVELVVIVLVAAQRWLSNWRLRKFFD